MKNFFHIISWLRYLFEKKEPEKVLVSITDCGGCGRCPVCISLNEIDPEKFRRPL